MTPSDDSDEEIQASEEGDEECVNCGSSNGDPLICDACSGTYCTNCDTHGKCPHCGEELP